MNVYENPRNFYKNEIQKIQQNRSNFKVSDRGQT